jgi:hypothetical protein
VTLYPETAPLPGKCLLFIRSLGLIQQELSLSELRLTCKIRGRCPANHQASLRSRLLIDSLTIRAVDGDFLATEAGEFYCHANESVFLFLIVGSERILVHDYNLGLRRAASFGKIWQHLFNSTDECGFSLHNIGMVASFCRKFEAWDTVGGRQRSGLVS